MGKHSMQENQKPGKEDDLTDSEKKKIKQANKAKANPEKAADKKAIRQSESCAIPTINAGAAAHPR